MIDPIDQTVDDGALAHVSARGGLVTTVAQIGRFLIRLMSQIAIARLLVPSDYGLVAMVAPVLALVSLLGDLGLGQSVVQRRDVTAAQVNGLFWVGLVVNSTLALLVMASAPLVAHAYGQPRLIGLTLWLALLIPIAGLTSQQSALFNRNMRFGLLAVVDLVPPAVGLASGLAAALHGWGYWSLVVLSGAEAITTSLLLAGLSDWRPGLPRYDPGIWSMVKVGGHITGYNLANYLTTTVDNILLGLLRGDVALGFYNKGYGIVTQPVSQFMTPFSRVAVPLFMRLAGDEQRYRDAFRRITQVMLLLAAPGIVATMGLAAPLMLILLGPQWTGIAPIVSWLCLGALASPLYSSTYWLFVSQHRTHEQLRYAFLTSAIAIAGFVVGLPWGAAGVAAGAGISFFAICTPLVCWGATRRGPVGFATIGRTVLPILAAVTIAGLALYLLRERVAVDGLSRAVAAIGFVYAVFALCLAAAPSGRRILADAWNTARLLRPPRGAPPGGAFNLP